MSAVLTCGGDAQIHESGIGLLRIGASVATIKGKCRVVRDTTVIDLEGMPARRMSVEIAGETVEGDIVNNKVWRVSWNAAALARLPASTKTTEVLIFQCAR